ncbi:hypothetical protein BAE44_0004931 [Dichanthelium oligosanthes]|uniref:Uncharacterized protein n=1 Tax=Dichanthelium oligosanthes TaxID=888268 RepID=A0A1E5W9G3_9POAL|nr:hypothetical protein BAE44_0004931 [Dichanthelium oligosanthes]
MASTTASNQAGLCLGELAVAAQGAWQAMAAGHSEQRPRQKQQKLGCDKKAAQGAAVAAGAKAAKERDVAGRCGGAMSDTTLCLLLDRFAPS